MKLKLFMIISTLVLLVQGVSFANAETAEFYYNRGRHHFENSDYYHAVEDYNQALHIKPDYVDALYGRAEIYLINNYFEEAERDFSAIIKTYPKYEKAYVGRGRLYYKAGYYNQAIADWIKALEINPNLHEVREELADVYLYQGTNKSEIRDLDGAIRDLTLVCLLSPENVEAWYRLGVLYLYSGDTEKAEECFFIIYTILEKMREPENFFYANFAFPKKIDAFFCTI